MSKLSEPRRAIEPENWKTFLLGFSRRNANRRARFDIFFDSGRTLEEAEEGHLEYVALRRDAGAVQIVIKRTDQSAKNAETMVDTIENVRGIGVQYDTDGSEDVLEITDGKNTLYSLRLESNVDGAS